MAFRAWVKWSITRLVLRFNRTIFETTAKFLTSITTQWMITNRFFKMMNRMVVIRGTRLTNLFICHFDEVQLFSVVFQDLPRMHCNWIFKNSWTFFWHPRSGGGGWLLQLPKDPRPVAQRWLTGSWRKSRLLFLGLGTSFAHKPDELKKKSFWTPNYWITYLHMIYCSFSCKLFPTDNYSLYKTDIDSLLPDTAHFAPL
jgi:hypothetical protein